MSYSVNWGTRVITIPKADTVLVSSSPDVRSLDVTDLWEALRDIEDDEVGINYPTIVANTTPKTVAGLTLARVVEIINGYTLTFENLPYAVNIIGGNSNVSDVVNKNQVSVNTSNSAGAIQIGGGAGDPWTVALPGAYPAGQAGNILGNLTGVVNGVDEAVMDQLVEGSLTVRHALRIMMAVLFGKDTRVGNTYYFRDSQDTKDRIVATVDDNKNRTSVTLDGT